MNRMHLKLAEPIESIDLLYHSAYDPISVTIGVHFVPVYPSQKTFGWLKQIERLAIAGASASESIEARRYFEESLLKDIVKLIIAIPQRYATHEAVGYDS